MSKYNNWPNIPCFAPPPWFRIILQDSSPVIVFSAEGRNLEDSSRSSHWTKWMWSEWQTGEILSTFVTEGHECFINYCQLKELMKKSTLFSECAKLLSFARPYWKYMVLAIISMVIYTSANGIQISLIKPIIDKLLIGNVKKMEELPRFDIDQNIQKQSSHSPVKQFKKQLFHKFTFIEKLQKRATGSFTSIGMVMAIVAPVIFLSCYFQQYFRNLVMWAVVVDIRNKVCDHLLPQPLSFFENRKSGDLLSRDRKSVV